MSDFAYVHAQPSALSVTAEGNTLALAAHAEDAPGTGAACFFQGRLRDTWLAASGLIILAKVMPSRFMPQRATETGQFQLSTLPF